MAKRSAKAPPILLNIFESGLENSSQANIKTKKEREKRINQIFAK